MNDVKVVILGQDPYHGPGQAHGLSFSVPKGVKPPPSLVNIFKAITIDLGISAVTNHGDLTPWADQGVLLLNAMLTVRKEAASIEISDGNSLQIMSLKNYQSITITLSSCYGADLLNKKNN